MKKIEITIIEGVEKGNYTASIRFKKDGNYLYNNTDLPHGHTQNITIDVLPFSFFFQINPNIYLENIEVEVILKNTQIEYKSSIFTNIDSRDLKEEKWIKIGEEGDFIKINKQVEVKYGIENNFILKTLNKDFYLNNETFDKDPIFGIKKMGYVRENEICKINFIKNIENVYIKNGDPCYKYKSIF